MANPTAKFGRGGAGESSEVAIFSMKSAEIEGFS
jgi:hypothetical protein